MRRGVEKYFRLEVFEREEIRGFDFLGCEKLIVMAGGCDSLLSAGSSLLVKDGKAVVGLSLSDKQPTENPKVIKHDGALCMRVKLCACVGGEVTSPYGIIKRWAK